MTSLRKTAEPFVRELKDDDISGESAKLAYYGFLSLFPLVLVLFALTGIVGGDRAFQWIMGQLGHAVPPDTAQYLGRFVADVTNRARPGLLSIGLLLSLWSASNVVTALGTGLNRMYDVRETRPWWKVRLLSLGVLMLGIVGVLGGSAAVLVGPEVLRALGLGPLWNLLSVPAEFVVVALTLFVIYYVLPNRGQRGAKRYVLLGAAVGALLWIATTFLFRVYVSHFGSYGKTYGVVGGVIVLLLWLYLSGFVVLFGAELAAWLEHRAGVPEGPADTLHAAAPA